MDAAGKHVTAGLIDSHSHSAISRSVNESGSAVTLEVRVADVLNPTDIAIYRELAGGLTTSLLLHGSANPMGGQAQVVKLRWGTDADGLRLDGAAPAVKFALGENVKQSNWGDALHGPLPAEPDGCRADYPGHVPGSRSVTVARWIKPAGAGRRCGAIFGSTRRLRY